MKLVSWILAFAVCSRVYAAVNWNHINGVIRNASGAQHVPVKIAKFGSHKEDSAEKIRVEEDDSDEDDYGEIDDEDSQMQEDDSEEDNFQQDDGDINWDADDTPVDIKITQEFYDRLVYFSKAAAMTSCISHKMILANKTLQEGGCPEHIKFCSDLVDNPTLNSTRVQLVLNADRGELGTGYVIVDHAREVIIVAFRGSSTRQDWFSDFQIYPVDYEPASKKRYKKLIQRKIIPPCNDCKIHRGFHRFSETLGSQFLENVETIFNNYNNYHVVVVGHSLGAAMATIAGIEFKLRGYNPTVLTYAPPRMFNSQMTEWIDVLFKTKETHERSIIKGELIFNHGSYFRVVHNQDYIPMVPPFYRTAGLEIFIEKVALPHTLQDLKYRGPTAPHARQNFKPNTINRAEDWLHTYQHRAYFIYINGCHGF